MFSTFANDPFFNTGFGQGYGGYGGLGGPGTMPTGFGADRFGGMNMPSRRGWNQPALTSDLMTPFDTSLTPLSTALTPLVTPAIDVVQPTGFWNWDRALTEPLMFGLEDLGNEYAIDIRKPSGLKRRDLKVEVVGNNLNIHGEHFYPRTGRSISFTRTVTLPQDVDKDKVAARYHGDGSLHIALPKNPTSIKHIPIQGYERLPAGSQQQQQQIEPGKVQEEKVPVTGSDKMDTEQKMPEQQQQTQQGGKNIPIQQVS